MKEELAVEVLVLDMKIARRSSPEQTALWLAGAVTRIPGEVRAKYLRDLGISSVTADVHVDAAGGQLLGFHAIVRVKVTYEGDMVKSSRRTRLEIDDRLQYLAQRHCADVLVEELRRSSREK